MMINRLHEIFNKVDCKERLTMDDCRFLLSFEDNSYEASLIRAKADAVIRERTDNSAIIIAQIGVDIHPCEANCTFCSFGEKHSGIPSFKVCKEDVKEAIENFCKEEDLYGIYLMTMADTNQEFLLDMIRYARSIAPASTQIWINTGDNDAEFYRQCKEAGASGAYQVCRIGEGIDTNLDPERRLQSMRYIKEAGLDLFSCCEPIGPETSIDEIAEKIMIPLDLGVTQFGAMKRIAVPGSPMEDLGQISNLKMAYVMGVVGLVYASVESARFFGIHEPCESGYLSGANFVTAEAGANPRDVELDTAGGRGWDMARCRKLMFDCGFKHLLRGDGSVIDLNYEYLKKTDSLK